MTKKKGDIKTSISVNGGPMVEVDLDKLTAKIGHNSGADREGNPRLRSYIERIERLEEEKAGLADDIKEIYAEAKGTGFEPKIIKRVIRLRKMDAQKRREEEELLELYMADLGMLSETPLGDAAVRSFNDQAA